MLTRVSKSKITDLWIYLFNFLSSEIKTQRQPWIKNCSIKSLKIWNVLQNIIAHYETKIFINLGNNMIQKKQISIQN
jgi:Leucine-rich repeat (LRR) protein